MDAEDLFEGWTVCIGQYGANRSVVERHEGELVLRPLDGDMRFPVDTVQVYGLYRVFPPLPTSPGLYVTEDPDLEVIELVADSGWRATDTEGRQLEVAEVRELGDLVHHVRSDAAAKALIHAMDEMKVAAMAGIRDAWAQLDAHEARGRRRALAEVRSLLRSRWWLWPVRVVFGRRFGAELLETGDGR
ncbi:MULTISPECIES: hypothetical protein [unclassified Pseudoclavibacter]|uniref:hypothetical protein n=1 Tax=unclassified Pseudoclavibacter TaxID=2615177 RepID=UPI001BABB72D|nr:hypothetical protein [Pseudoclavibacter sp. Marseille-Q4354]MBS3177731.1 hypothetical protein [Pseudoclavibacter sp. Marseille-Q4354]